MSQRSLSDFPDLRLQPMRELAESPGIVLEKNPCPIMLETAASRISGIPLNPFSSIVFKSTDRVAAHGSKLIYVAQRANFAQSRYRKIPKYSPMSITFLPACSVRERSRRFA